VNPAYYGIHCKPLLNGFGHLIGFGTAPIPSTLTGTVLISSTETDGLLWGPGSCERFNIAPIRRTLGLVWPNISSSA
jgi:hypothetical protein